VTRGRFALAGAVIALGITGCGGSKSHLSVGEIHSALERLPYRYDYRRVSYSGNGAVVAGTARSGPHFIYFAVIAGHPKINGRAVPRQRLPNGHFQHGVDAEYGSSGTPWETQFVYPRSSIAAIGENIITAICEAAGTTGCRGPGL
jgi:hypothetical protein